MKELITPDIKKIVKFVVYAKKEKLNVTNLPLWIRSALLVWKHSVAGNVEWISRQIEAP